MDVSDEAIALFYLLNDGVTLTDVTEGDSFTIQAMSEYGDIPVIRLSSTLTNRHGRMMYSSRSKLAIRDGMYDFLRGHIKTPIPITPDLLEESRFYAKFVEL